MKSSLPCFCLPDAKFLLLFLSQLAHVKQGVHLRHDGLELLNDRHSGQGNQLRYADMLQKGANLLRLDLRLSHSRLGQPV